MNYIGDMGITCGSMLLWPQSSGTTSAPGGCHQASIPLLIDAGVTAPSQLIPFALISAWNEASTRKVGYYINSRSATVWYQFHHCFHSKNNNNGIQVGKNQDCSYHSTCLKDLNSPSEANVDKCRADFTLFCRFCWLCALSPPSPWFRLVRVSWPFRSKMCNSLTLRSCLIVHPIIELFAVPVLPT